jgi:hypothetical protein
VGPGPERGRKEKKKERKERRKDKTTKDGLA